MSRLKLITAQLRAMDRLGHGDSRLYEALLDEAMRLTLGLEHLPRDSRPALQWAENR